MINSESTARRPRVGEELRLPLSGELHDPRFDEVKSIMTKTLNRPGHIRAADGSVVRLDTEFGAYVGTYYRPDMSVRAVVYGSLAEVQTAMRGWKFVA